MNYDKIMYWLCLGCVIYNGFAFITTGSIIALVFALICAYSLWGR